MAAVIIPRDQLRIPEHLRGRLERPALRVVAPPTGRSATVVPLRPVVGNRPVGAPRRGAVAPLVREPLAAGSSGSGAARLVVAACLAIVALTGVTALAAGGRTSAPEPVVAPAAVAAPVAIGDVWVVQPGDSLWSIAAAVAPGTDLRPVVDELARRAGGGGLQPGQRIAIDGIVP